MPKELSLALECNVKNFVKRIRNQEYNLWNTPEKQDFRTGMICGFSAFLRMQGHSESEVIDGVTYLHTLMEGDRT